MSSLHLILIKSSWLNSSSKVSFLDMGTSCIEHQIILTGLYSYKITFYKITSLMLPYISTNNYQNLDFHSD